MIGRSWESLGRPCSERVVTKALTFAERRASAFGPGRCVVVHGDPHPGNALRVPGPGPRPVSSSWIPTGSSLIPRTTWESYSVTGVRS